LLQRYSNNIWRFLYFLLNFNVFYLLPRYSAGAGGGADGGGAADLITACKILFVNHFQ
jgi:hypothetical protein